MGGDLQNHSIHAVYLYLISVAIVFVYWSEAWTASLSLHRLLKYQIGSTLLSVLGAL
ncbi:hypothetical protein K503DRAFT_588011 [Rhizopogon vinicolor AM-OR11-026]|uniref:Uncharacterized protein n=1 Tax=Rhizopogon vinicolor AM-OR11-026 TaxID=1314800 RepID=A0A1B7MJA9_9AGAM|nr:hypothetical protein K503DRAFT_588011 [Rhizopogon vinicolor AM-OR11-026]